MALSEASWSGSIVFSKKRKNLGSAEQGLILKMISTKQDEIKV